LTSSQPLVLYDPYKLLVLSCDALPYGVGSILSHKLNDGSEYPVAFASGTLSPAEKRYSQVDKEGLAIIFGVKRLYYHLLGRKFTIFPDHKPLQHLFDRSKAIPPLASARIQGWALTLSAYDYDINYKPGKDQTDLIRLPLPELPKETAMPADTVLWMESLLLTLLPSQPRSPTFKSKATGMAIHY